MAGANAAIQWIDTIWMIIKYGWWLGIVLWIGYLKIKYKNYPIEAVILEKRGNNLIKTNDRVGKFVDPYTNIIGYRFLKSKDTIPVVDFEWVLHNNRQDIGIMDKLVNKLWGNAGTVMFYKYGSRQYKPIEITQGNETKIEWQEVKDAKGNPITVSILRPIDPRDKMAGLDFAVVDWDNINFMTQEQRASIERRKKKSEFWKQILIPAMIIGGAVVVVVIMMKFGYDFAMEMKNTNLNQQQQQTQPSNTNPNIPVIGDLLPK